MIEIKTKIWFNIDEMNEILSNSIQYLNIDLKHLLKELLNYNLNMTFFTFTLSNSLENYE